jgi:hypothetical protein
MNNLKNLLVEFDAVLKEKNLVNYNKLLAPLPKEKVESVCDKLNIIDEDFKLLYGWKNGVDTFDNQINQCSVVDWGTFLSIENILEFSEQEETRWDKQYIPIVSNYDGDFLVLNNETGDDFGKIHLYSVALLQITPTSYFDSIYQMINTNLQAYKEQYIKYDEREDWLQIDIDKFALIAKSINKKSEYWVNEKS